MSLVNNFKPVVFDVSTTNQAVHSKEFPVTLKAGGRYRVSYTICGRDLDQYGSTQEQLRIAKMWGGVMSNVKCGRKSLGSIGRGVRGTFKPVVQAYEFSVPAGDRPEVKAILQLMTVWTTGHAEFDNLLLEELP